MTRKDTIMIAALVNAALLAGLFISAIKNDDNKSEKFVTEVKPVEIAAAPKQEVKSAQGDVIDQVLKEFSQKNEEKPSTQKVDFAKELEAITKSAPKVAATPAQSGKGYSEVKVKQGDALEKIARAHNTTVGRIIEYNNLRSTVLQIGQTLKIPSSSGAQAPKGAETTNSEFYVVKSGDNPWTIAVKNHIKVDELLKLNDLNDQKARRLKPGDKLRIK